MERVHNNVQIMFELLSIAVWFVALVYLTYDYSSSQFQQSNFTVQMHQTTPDSHGSDVTSGDIIYFSSDPAE